jgi:hypothetical protein
VSQTGVVSGLAVRELWISFRLFVIVTAFVASGALVALVPAPLPATLERLAIGLAASTLVAAGVAAWSMAAERRAGRAGWLVVRSVPRGTLLAAWFAAVGGVAIVALIAAAVLGWLAVSSVALRLEPGGFITLAIAAGASALAAVATGLLAGTLLAPPAAVAVTMAVCLVVGVAGWLLPIDATLVPGGALAALASLREPGGSAAPGLRAAGIGLATAAVMLLLARAAIERAEL